MLLLSGPTAAGKNTVGALIARQRPRCALVDFDAFRAMLVQPHAPPWAGEEGLRQEQLGVRLACQAAATLSEDGWEVIMLDVVSERSLPLYWQHLAGQRLALVQLLPSFDELRRRFLARGPCLTDEELRAVYQQQLDFRSYDLRLDTTHLAPDQTARRILEWQGRAGRL